ncbi:MAG: hypothetical protein Q8P57_00255 [Candidatus Pacearchaeota archaeon]|nr:hypothetical protein [Candidatus Pacearchaeota archaeon]
MFIQPSTTIFYRCDEERDKLVVGEVWCKRSGGYARKDGRKIVTFYNKKLGKKKDVPEFFRERLRESERVLEKSGNLSEKNLDFVIFRGIYFKICLIVGQPPLLCAPSVTK